MFEQKFSNKLSVPPLPATATTGNFWSAIANVISLKFSNYDSNVALAQIIQNERKFRKLDQEKGNADSPRQSFGRSSMASIPSWNLQTKQKFSTTNIFYSEIFISI